MKKLIKYLPFHFLLCLIIGIIIQFQTTVWQYSFVYMIGICIVLTIILFFSNKHKTNKLFSVTTLMFFIFIGISSVFIHNSKNKSNYYENYLVDNSKITVRINKILKSGFYNYKFIGEVFQVNDNKTSGKLLINLKKDSVLEPLKVDDLLYISSEIAEIKKALNPHQFDYKKYLAKQYVYKQVFIKKSNFKLLKSDNISIFGISEQIRNKIQASLKKHSFTKDEFSVINALLLGQRQDISKTLLDSYTNAGAVHILAISGLHIGIILLLLTSLLKPIERLRHGAFIKTTFIVLLLWMFAFIAGLSASVVRAVTMFTFIAIGSSFKKKKVIEFSLISSMFILLLVKPLFLFDVGFQLSYLAVFGIIWIQPILYKLWIPKFWIFDKIWSLTTVSIAAQIGILPISLYYFHQFPGLFIVSNLVIIPFLGGILMGGILVIILALLNLLPQFIVDLYGLIISLMNKIVNWVSLQEQFLFQEISMPFLEMILWYFIIILCYQFVLNKKPKQLIYLLLSVFIFQIHLFHEKTNRETKQEFIVFHKSKNNILGIRNGINFKVFHSLDSTTLGKDYILKSYRINENVKSLLNTKKTNLINFKSDKILLVDSLGIYNINYKKPIVILQQSPKINLTRLIKKLKPKQIIADGSNYKSYIINWKKICEKQKTPFYHTGKNGAYIITGK